MKIAIAFPSNVLDYWLDMFSEAVASTRDVAYFPCGSADDLERYAPDIIVGQSVSFVLDYLATRPANLRWFHVMSTGVEQVVAAVGINVPYFVTNVSGIHRVAMREYVLAMMLHFTKRITYWQEQRAQRQWHPERLSVLSGATLLIVGTGNIGDATAELGKALGMRVLGISRSGVLKPPYDSVGRPDRLFDAAAEADYVLASLPLTPSSQSLFDQRFFAAAKRGAVFINISRGALVDENAMIDALDQGQLAGAALDVFQQEPLPAQSRLWSIPNAVVTPHVAGRFADNHQLGIDLFRENLVRFQKNKPMDSLVDLARGY